MQLDKVTAKIRPRRPWEAVDLGFAMVRAWWQPLIISWIIVSLPVLLLVLALMTNHLFWSIFILWWLKPLWERTQLFILSRALFGDTPSVYETVSSFPKLAFSQIIASLTWRRFSLSRSMNLPVQQLENLSGSSRTQRLAILHRQDSEPAAWITLLGHLFEFIFCSSLISLIFIFIPEKTSYLFNDIIKTPSYIISSINILCYYIVISCMAPFYVASGFALYLNRRILLEAWDIDIAFRRMLEKRQPKQKDSFMAAAQIAALVLMAALLSPTHSVFADDNNVETTVATKQELDRIASMELVAEVMASPDFNQTKTVTMPKFLLDLELEENEDPEFDWSAFGWLGALVGESLRILIWAAVILLIIMLIMRFSNWTAPWSPSNKRSKQSRPETLFGLDLRRQSLPDDITQAALTLCKQQRYREALALLYRATLSLLIDHHQLSIRKGYTETECERLIADKLPEQISNYFTQLNRLWIPVAYGHKAPNTDLLIELCNNWQSTIDPDDEQH